MKTFCLITQAFIVSCVFLNAVISEPQLYQASDGKEYLIETELKYNWYQASHECARRDSQLLIIDSEAKNNVIIDMLEKVIGKSHNLWLGGNDEISSSSNYTRSFFWSATGKPFSFTYWSENNPNNNEVDEHCVHIWDRASLYQWNDIDCTRKMGFICEANLYAETYKIFLKNTCDAFNDTTSLISNEFAEVQKRQNLEINTKNQNINHVAENFKIDLQKLEHTTHADIQHILEEHKISSQQLTEKILKQISQLNDELKKSTEEINTQFTEKLIVKQNEINKAC